MNEKDFKALQLEWYAKLEKSGFKDIEGPSQDLSVTTKLRKRGHKIEQIHEYYTKAQNFLEEYEFRKQKHKEIWLLHVNGDSIRDIAKKLKLSKSDVHRIVKEHQNIMLGAY